MTKYATISAFIGFEGDNVQLLGGAPWDDDHPLVKARPDLFTDTPPGELAAEPAAEPEAKPAPTAKAKRPGAARG